MSNFSQKDIERRFNHQKARCALCSKKLIFENRDIGNKGAWTAHHCDGNYTNKAYSNCACVCINDPPNCHLNVAHGGDFKSTYLAPLSWYRLKGWKWVELQGIDRSSPSLVEKFHKEFMPLRYDDLRYMFGD